MLYQFISQFHNERTLFLVFHLLTLIDLNDVWKKVSLIPLNVPIQFSYYSKELLNKILTSLSFHYEASANVLNTISKFSPTYLDKCFDLYTKRWALNQMASIF